MTSEPPGKRFIISKKVIAGTEISPVFITSALILSADKIKAEVMNTGEISVPAITFFEIIKRLPGGSDVMMSMDDSDSEIIINFFDHLKIYYIKSIHDSYKK